MREKIKGSLQLVGKILVIFIFPVIFFSIIGDNPFKITERASGQIAIVNEDIAQEQGGEAISFGRELANVLGRNSEYHWTVIGRSAAEQGLAENRFDAIVYIPSDFTKNILTFSEQLPVKASLEYKIQDNMEAKHQEKVQKELERMKNDINAEIGIIYWGYVAQELSDIRGQFDQVLDKEIEFLDSISTFYRESSADLIVDIDTQKNQLESLIASLGGTAEFTGSSVDFAESAVEQLNQYAQVLEDYKQYQKEHREMILEKQEENKQLIQEGLDKYREVLLTGEATIKEIGNERGEGGDWEDPSYPLNEDKLAIDTAYEELVEQSLQHIDDTTENLWNYRTERMANQIENLAALHDRLINYFNFETNNRFLDYLQVKLVKVKENPEEPDEPEEPGDPGEPGNPGNPGDPGEPGNPGKPGEPGDPENPDEPGEPGDPENPDEPGEPGDPGDGNEAEHSFNPVEGAETVDGRIENTDDSTVANGETGDDHTGNDEVDADADKATSEEIEEDGMVQTIADELSAHTGEEGVADDQFGEAQVDDELLEIIPNTSTEYLEIGAVDQILHQLYVISNDILEGNPAVKDFLDQIGNHVLAQADKIESLAEENDQLKEIIKKLKKKLKEKKKIIVQLKKENEKLKNENIALREELKNLQEEYDDLNARYEFLRMLFFKNREFFKKFIAAVRDAEERILNHEQLPADRKGELENIFAKEFTDNDPIYMVEYYSYLISYEQVLNKMGEIDPDVINETLNKEAFIRAVNRIVYDTYYDEEANQWKEKEREVLQNLIDIVKDGKVNSKEYFDNFQTFYSLVLDKYQTYIDEQYTFIINTIDDALEQTVEAAEQIKAASEDQPVVEETPLVEQVNAEIPITINDTTLNNLQNLSEQLDHLLERQDEVNGYTYSLQSKVHTVQNNANHLNNSWAENIDFTEQVQQNVYDLLGNTEVDGQANPYVYEYLANPIVMSGEMPEEERIQTPPVTMLVIVVITGILIGFFVRYYSHAPLSVQLVLYMLVNLAAGLIISMYGLNIYKEMTGNQGIRLTILTVMLLFAISSLVKGGFRIGPFIGISISTMLVVYFVLPILDLVLPNFTFDQPIAKLYTAIRYNGDQNLFWPIIAILTVLVLIIEGLQILLRRRPSEEDEDDIAEEA